MQGPSFCSPSDCNPMEAAQLRSVLISLRLNLSPAMLRRGPRHSAAPRRPPPLRCQSPLQAGAGDAGKLAETLSLDTDDAEHWSDEEKEAFTAAAIEGFLQSAAPHRKRRRRHYNERHSNQHSGSTSGAKTSEHGINSGRSADGGGRYPPTEPGLQSKVVGHLLAGDFCEELLSSTPPQTLNWAVKTLGVNSRPDLAEQLFHWMRVRCIANEHSLVKLFEAFEACRQAPVKSLQTWRNVRRMHCPFVPGARSAAALLKVYRAAGDVSGALRTLSELQSRGTQLNQYAYNVAIRACADVGDAEAAFQVFEQLREHSSAHADIRTFSALMDAVAKSGRWSRTTLVHRLLIEDGLTPDATLYLQILAGYAGAARPDAAEAVFDRMQDGGVKPNRSHWNALLAAYAEARQYDACLGVYRRMTETAGLPPNGQSFVALLHAAKGARAGHAAAAWVLHLMREKGIPVGVEVGTALIACCRHAAPGADAKRAISLAQEVMQEMRAAQVELNIKTFNSMMLVYADVQCPAGIKSVLADLEATENVAPNEATWGIAIAAFQAAGWWDQVESAEALRDTLRTLHGMADD